MSHFTCTHRGQVNSWLLVVRSQIVNLTPGLSFIHNLCCKCPNGSCKAIFDIFVSRTFQRYKEHLRARCFDPYNWTLSFWESRRTPKSPFRECECHPHTPSKWGCNTQGDTKYLFLIFTSLVCVFFLITLFLQTIPHKVSGFFIIRAKVFVRRMSFVKRRDIFRTFAFFSFGKFMKQSTYDELKVNILCGHGF